MARKRRAYGGYQAHRQRNERLAASTEAEVLAARLQTQLTREQWTQVQANWEARPDLYMPQDRLSFLISEADRLGVLDLLPLATYA